MALEKQSKWASLFESVMNTLVAFVITMCFLPLVNWICGVEMNARQVTTHVVLMTILSIARNYVIRRTFNNLEWFKTRLRRILPL